jgi:hypothetical protein
VGLLLVSGSVDVPVEKEEGNGVRNEENVPGVFSAGLKHQLTGAAEAVYCAHFLTRPPWARQDAPLTHATTALLSSPFRAG